MLIRDHEATELLGKRVRITITDGHDEEQVIVAGQLLAFGDQGEALVLDDCYDVIRCWPMLAIEEV